MTANGSTVITVLRKPELVCCSKLMAAVLTFL